MVRTGVCVVCGQRVPITEADNAKTHAYTEGEGMTKPLCPGTGELTRYA